MALPNLSGSNIQDTFQRVLHTDGALVYDGTGSLLPIAFESGDISASGNITANSSTLIEGSTSFPNKSGNGYKFGGSTTKRADSGFISDGVNAKTHITPQHTSKPMFFLGHHKNVNNDVDAYPNNYITFNKKLYFNPNEGGGGIKPDSDKPTFQIDGNLQVVQPLNALNTGSTDPKSGVLITPNPNIYFFNGDASGSISGSHQIASASAQIKFDTGSSALKIFAGSTSEELLEVMHISRSGANPRIGIGITNPIKAFDFKSVSDDARGGELLIRGSRTSVGAVANDEVGRINFAIDSSSYAQVDISGSAAEIVSIVDTVDDSGIQGSLSLRVASAKETAPIQRIKISGTVAHASQPFIEFTGSAAMDSDLAVGGDLTLSGKIDSYITASSGISASGEIIANELTLYDDLNLKENSIINFAKSGSDGGVHPGVNVATITLSDSNGSLNIGSGNASLQIHKYNGIVYNESAQLVSGVLARDFRVEGYGDTHLFFISGSANKIGIGTSTPGEKLEVVGNISASGIITATSFVGNMDGGTF